MKDEKDEQVLCQFDRHIHALRTAKDPSLREGSYACNIDNSKIPRTELGKTNVTILTILELAIGLDASPSELLNFSFRP